MKSPYIFFIALFFIANANSQELNLDWAASMGSSNYDVGYSITNDSAGNSFTVGIFYGEVEFTPGDATTELSSNGSYDVFIQKRNLNGDLLWVTSFGGSLQDYSFSSYATPNGGVVLTGSFRGTAYFDINNVTDSVVSIGSEDIFVMSIDADGEILWVKSIGGIYTSKGESVTVDNDGNVFISGVFQLTVDFDPGIGINSLSSNGLRDIFVLKLNSDGDFVWAKSFGGTGWDGASEISINSTNEVIVYGQFRLTVDFDPGVDEFELTTDGAYHVFILKLSNDGDFSWVKSIGNSLSVYTEGMTIDVNDNILLIGDFADTVDFDPGIGVFNLVSEAFLNQTSPFICKLTNDGDFSWAKAILGDGFAYLHAIAVDNASNIIVGGEFEGTLDFDPGLEEYNLDAIGYNDGFVMKLSSDGNFNWMKSMYGSESAFFINSLSIANEGQILVTGEYNGTIDFDPGNETFTQTSDGQDIVILQLIESLDCSDLFFSEYIEGSSSNKAFEIYNSSNESIDLSDYVIYRNNNGSLSPTDSLFMAGILEADETYIVGNSLANASIIDVADTLHSMTFYNGDDALWIKKISTGDTLDIIGEIGDDPGTGWTVGTGSTNNYTLLRKIEIQKGSKDWSNSSMEWDVFAIDMTDSLGNHSMNPCIECIPIDVSIIEYACDSYTSPSGNYIWTSSNTYIDTLITETGCDSIISIDLTIHNSSRSTLTISSCGAYTSPSGNYIWTNSNSYIDTITNAAGCDSILNIDLTILNSSSSTLTISSCGAYTSPSGNYIWTSSNTYTDTIPNLVGCDSIMSINLTILNSTSSSISTTACNSYTSPSGNYIWTNTGVYNDTLLNSQGCDSVITIDLLINTLDLSITNSDPTLMANAVDANYQWLDCDAFYEPIFGETSQSYSPLSNGNYAVMITQNSCVDTSDCVSVSTVGIIENEIFMDVMLFPNPSQGHVLINLASIQNVSIKVFSLKGQLLYAVENINDPIHEFDLDVSPGIYSVEINTGQEKKEYKLVIE